MIDIRSCTNGFILAFFFVLATDRVSAQNSVLPACAEADWNKIRISKENIPEGKAKIFIITNRPYVPKADPEYFPNGMADSLTYFVAACSGDNWDFHFVPGFKEGMNAINDGRNILIFIEGHGKTLPMALDRAYQVQLRYNLSIVVFDWPSDNSNFYGSLSAIRRCEGNFYDFLLQMKEYRKRQMNKSQHLSILAHSMGNCFLDHLMERDKGSNLSEVFVDNIIMNAPAIPSKGHGEAISKMAFQKRIYITSNRKDMVLRGASVLASSRMLGNIVIGPLATNAYYIDFSDVAGNEHSYYYGHQPFESTVPAFYFFYNTSFNGNEVDFSESKMFIPQESNKRYAINGTTEGKKEGT
jgi:Alpha/beta hydrolase of unknown function (DUF900)